VELIASAAAQPQPLEAVVGLQVCKARDLANAFIFICRRATIRGLLVKIARDLARLVPGVAATSVM
jgi:hypothetical protein